MGRAGSPSRPFWSGQPGDLPLPLAAREATTSFPALRRLAAGSQFIEHDGQHDDRSLDHQLPIERDVHQSQTVIEYGDNQGSNQSAEHRSYAPNKARATQDNGSNGV